MLWSWRRGRHTPQPNRPTGYRSCSRHRGRRAQEGGCSPKRPPDVIREARTERALRCAEPDRSGVPEMGEATRPCPAGRCVHGSESCRSGPRHRSAGERPQGRGPSGTDGAARTRSTTLVAPAPGRPPRPAPGASRRGGRRNRGRRECLVSARRRPRAQLPHAAGNPSAHRPGTGDWRTPSGPRPMSLRCPTRTRTPEGACEAASAGRALQYTHLAKIAHGHQPWDLTKSAKDLDADLREVMPVADPPD
jgi:hypothetical protein